MTLTSQCFVSAWLDGVKPDPINQNQNIDSTLTVLSTFEAVIIIANAFDWFLFLNFGQGCS